MKTFFAVASLALLLLVPSQCFALWGLMPIPKERANDYGAEVHTTEAAANQVIVELTIKTDGLLKDFSRIELRIGEGDNPSVTAPLKEDRSKPGVVTVHFNADRKQMATINLRVMVPGTFGGTVYIFPMKDYVAPK